MIYITENEALFNEIAEEKNEAAPVIEKVSLAEIQQEQNNEKFEEVAGVLEEYLQLTPEEKDAVLSGIFE